METNERIEYLENMVDELLRFKRESTDAHYAVQHQSQLLTAPITAYVIDTIDPDNLNGIRFFSPRLHEPDTKISNLPFARAVSAFGGHDDCGLTWVPPAGSKVVILHENGNRGAPMYIGTTWNKYRGPDGNLFPYPILEYQRLFCDRGDGYLVGNTDGSQVQPPWDTENYNQYNLDSPNQTEMNPNAQNMVTYPNIYGFKTPGKHWFKMVDGDYRCQNHWKRVEIGTGGGGWMCFKDDYLHPGGQWGNPSACNNQCTPGSLDDECLDISSLLNDENAFGTDGTDTQQQQGGCIVNTKGQNCRTLDDDDPQPANPYFKRLEEMRPILGANTPQNNKMRLPQSGWQVQSISGHQIVMDDSVDQPQGQNDKWQREFDFGCTDLFTGKMFFKSTTGHLIEINDKESATNERGTENGINFVTAAGHVFQMIDHTVNGIAGDQRQIMLKSTSGGALVINDKGNKQKSPNRMEGGEITSKADNAYVLLRSGYGLMVRLDDDYSQDNTDQQAISIIAPRSDAPVGGPAPDGRAAGVPGVQSQDNCKQGHLTRMQLDPITGGFVLTSSGGYYITTSIKDNIEEVGRTPCPADKILSISGSYLMEAKDFVLAISETEIHLANQYIVLGAGDDCKNVNAQNANAQAQQAIQNAQQQVAAAMAAPNVQVRSMDQCFYPIIVAKNPWTCPLTNQVHWNADAVSKRVFAS